MIIADTFFSSKSMAVLDGIKGKIENSDHKICVFGKLFPCLQQRQKPGKNVYRNIIPANDQSFNKKNEERSANINKNSTDITIHLNGLNQEHNVISNKSNTERANNKIEHDNQFTICRCY